MSQLRRVHGVVALPTIAAALAGIISAAAPAHAQSGVAAASWLCSPLVHAQRPVGLVLFAGTYQLAHATAADSSDGRELGGFAELVVPQTVGYASGNAYAALDHGNFAAGDAATIHAGWTSPEFGGPVHSDLESDLRHAENAGWCVSPQRGSFRLRAAVQQDLRWESKDFATVLWCEARPTWLGGGPTCARRYVGRPVYATLVPGDSFPVQRYSVLDPRRAGNAGYVARVRASAESQANALYVDRRSDRPMAFSTYELLLTGVIARQGGGYARTLVGELRRRTYQDPRIGLIDTVGGTEWRMSVLLTTSRLPGSAASLVAQFCGTPAGCGVADTTLAAGGLVVGGSDDSVRFDAMCAHLSGQPHCIDSTNVDLPPTRADPQRVQDVLTRAGTPSPPLTDAERTSSLDGLRGAGVPARAPAQWARVCARLARDDSVSRANAPVPEGVARLPAALDTARLSACLRGQTDAFSGAL